MIKLTFFVLNIKNEHTYLYNKVFTKSLIRENSLACWNCKSTRQEMVKSQYQTNMLILRRNLVDKIFCSLTLMCKNCVGYVFKRSDWNRSYEHLGL